MITTIFLLLCLIVGIGKHLCQFLALLMGISRWSRSDTVSSAWARTNSPPEAVPRADSAPPNHVQDIRSATDHHAPTRLAG
jgi:hypothetical protein